MPIALRSLRIRIRSQSRKHIAKIRCWSSRTRSRHPSNKRHASSGQQHAVGFGNCTTTFFNQEAIARPAYRPPVTLFGERQPTTNRMQQRSIQQPNKDEQMTFKTYFREANLVGGEWISADSAGTIDVTNPATGDMVGTIPNCGTDETNRAIDAASAAFPGFAAMPLPTKPRWRASRPTRTSQASTSSPARSMKPPSSNCTVAPSWKTPRTSF